MTDDAGTGADHLDLDTLAELEEGLRPASEATAAEAHLAGCRPCREQQARLRSTRALLGALPAEPMPPDVAERVRGALARSAATTVLPVAGELGGRRSRWRSRPTIAGLGAAAAVTALVAAVVIGSTQSSSDNNGGDTTAAAGPTADRAAGAPRSFPLTTSGRHYTADNAQRLVRELARSTTTAAPAPSGAAAGGAAESQAAPARVPTQLETLYTSQDALLACVAALTVGHPVLPLAVDFATYTDKKQKLHNAPAIVVVLPGTPAHADGWIVGPECATAADNDFYAFMRVPLG